MCVVAKWNQDKANLVLFEKCFGLCIRPTLNVVHCIFGAVLDVILHYKSNIYIFYTDVFPSHNLLMELFKNSYLADASIVVVNIQANCFLILYQNAIGNNKSIPQNFTPSPFFSKLYFVKSRHYQTESFCSQNHQGVKNI